MPEDVDLPHYLRMIAAAVAALAGLYYLLSRFGKGATESTETESSISSSDWRPALDRHTAVPRHLPENPFSGSENLADFCSEIESAAKASASMSRAIGLIYFEFPKLVSGAATGGGLQLAHSPTIFAAPCAQPIMSLYWGRTRSSSSSACSRAGETWRRLRRA